MDVLKLVTKGKRVEFAVVTSDRSNQLCKKGGSKVIVQAQSNRDVAPVEVKDNKDGSYSVSFVANQIGEVKLSVTIKGQQIKGSPFIVKVHGNYTTIDKPSKVVNAGGRMEKPCDIAFGQMACMLQQIYPIIVCGCLMDKINLLGTLVAKELAMVDSVVHVG